MYLAPSPKCAYSAASGSLHQRRSSQCPPHPPAANKARNSHRLSTSNPPAISDSHRYPPKTETHSHHSLTHTNAHAHTPTPTPDSSSTDTSVGCLLSTSPSIPGLPHSCFTHLDLGRQFTKGPPPRRELELDLPIRQSCSFILPSHLSHLSHTSLFAVYCPVLITSTPTPSFFCQLLCTIRLFSLLLVLLLLVLILPLIGR